MSDEYWKVENWMHFAYGIGGLFTFGLLWAAWLVHVIAVEVHNANVHKR